MKDAHILIISTKVDVSTDAVIHLLNSKGFRNTRLNTEDFPFGSDITINITPNRDKAVKFFYRQKEQSRISLGDVSSVWYRRVRIPEKPATMLPGVYDFCLREARAALLGSVQIQTTRIMSPPEKVWAAEQKPYQLFAAKAVGLQVPETLITNDPDEIRAAFFRFNQKMIAKPVRSGFVDYGTEQHAIYTSQVLEKHLDKLESAHLSPAIYQPLIEKKCDVRVTIVGDQLFVAEIDSQTDPSALVDWRKTVNPALPHNRGQLPPSVSKGIQRLVYNLGLAFGAVDLIRTRDDEYVFLEINPNGQWLWLDDHLELGITESIVSWLSESIDS